MSKDLQLFKHESFGEVRTLVKDGEPLFNLNDVCKILEIKHVPTVKKRLGDDVVSNHPIKDALNRTQQATFVNEDGLYDVIFDSRKKEAREFRKWVTSEVLPKIRKEGMYVSDNATDEQKLYNYDLLESTFSKMGTEFFLEEYRSCIEFHKNDKTRLEFKRKHKSRRSDKLRTESDSRIMIMEKVLDVALERSEGYREGMQWELKSLLDEVVKEIQMDVQEVKRNIIRGKSAYKTRQLNELNEEHEELQQGYEANREPKIDEYHTINFHPLSENSMYQSVVGFDGKAHFKKTRVFEDWIDKFKRQTFEMPKTKDMGLDTTKPMKIYLAYDHLDKFDSNNFKKSIIDIIADHYRFNDKLIMERLDVSNKIVSSYDEGKIYFYLENIKVEEVAV